MTATGKALLAYFVLILVVFAWMFRLDVKASPQKIGAAYITDRWFASCIAR